MGKFKIQFFCNYKIKDIVLTLIVLSIDSNQFSGVLVATPVRRSSGPNRTKLSPPNGSSPSVSSFTPVARARLTPKSKQLVEDSVRAKTSDKRRLFKWNVRTYRATRRCVGICVGRTSDNSYSRCGGCVFY